MKSLSSKDYVADLRSQLQTRLNETYDQAKKNREEFVIEEFAEAPVEQVSPADSRPRRLNRC